MASDNPDEPQPEEQPEDGHEHHEHQFMVMGPYGPMTGEQYAAMVDQQNAHLESSAHQAVNFFDDLNEEQLVTFRGILNALAHRPKQAIPYYQAMASSALKYRFGVCPACTKKHDEVLAEMTGLPGEAIREEPEDVEELKEQARVWNVDFMDNTDGRPLSLTPVFCLAECGASWPNLADRMLRKPGPDGCDGCQQKAKFG
jgi:hypothetical protein